MALSESVFTNQTNAHVGVKKRNDLLRGLVLAALLSAFLWLLILGAVL